MAKNGEGSDSGSSEHPAGQNADALSRRRLIAVGALGVAGLGGLIALSRRTNSNDVAVAVDNDGIATDAESYAETTLSASSLVPPTPTAAPEPEIAAGRAEDGPFAGLLVADFPATPPGPGIASRINVDYGSGVVFDELVDELAAHPNTAALEGLVIGGYVDDLLDNPSPAVNKLIAVAASFPTLRALYVGDITRERSEISWNELGNQAALANAFPKLETLRVRGAGSMSMTGLALPKLKSLTIISGGLNPGAVRDVLAAKLPALEHLELWLGTPEYGGEAKLSDLEPLLQNIVHPNLKYVGLRNSEIADEIAKALADSPRIATATALDLSLGTLGNEGFAALQEMAPSNTLKSLNVSYHYADTEAVAALTKAMADRGIEVDASDQQKEFDDNMRIVSISE